VIVDEDSCVATYLF